MILFFEWKYEFISSMKRFIDDLRSENVIMLEYLKNRKHTVILNIEAIINWIGNDKIIVREFELLKKSICEKNGYNFDYINDLGLLGDIILKEKEIVKQVYNIKDENIKINRDNSNLSIESKWLVP